MRIVADSQGGMQVSMTNKYLGQLNQGTAFQKLVESWKPFYSFK